ncbi:MAG TPA: right-handed parallel beta-helix repeat-containing protein, partial [Candidatus Cloacimonadota bacterium]|nr:right-handed parallel beta-helix repeat-containing protein [Candidatus Cloacimonadota bacterium]
MRFGILLVLCLLPILIFSQTYIPAGDVSGNWSYQNQPYFIEGNISIPADQALTIEAGVEVIFQGHYEFEVLGKLTAIGTETDSIRFTAANTDEGWHGMRFINTETNGQDGQILSYCILEYGNALSGNEENTRGGALSCLYSSDVLIDNCRFSHNQADYGGAIELRYSDIFMQNCLISDNYASHDAGGIIITDESEATINSSIIRNNSCYFNGGGIYCCNNASPTLNDVIISKNSTTCDDGYNEPGGGGISCHTASMELNNVSITDNICMAYGRGGGIECGYNSVINFTNGIVSNNQAIVGGGIANFNTLNLAGVTISFNRSGFAGGIYQLGELNLDSANRCNIYLNDASDYTNTGNDLYSYGTNMIIVDTFTVMNPTDYHATPIDNFTFDILHAKIEQITSDMYVSPSGSNHNSGLTPDDPLLTIYQALQMINPDSLNHLTIHLDEGLYSPSQTGEIMPIQMIDYLTLDGAGRTTTILDAEGADQAVETYALEDCIISNLSVTNGIDQGISCSDSKVTINNLYLYENSNGISLYACPDVNILNSIITNNRNQGLYCNDTDIFLSSVSIFQNSGANIGGGVYFVSSSVEFDSENRCSIYLNSANYLGQDIAIYNTPIYAVLDTFTVMQPCPYFVNNLENFTYDILNAKIETVDADVYVSPSGSDENSGLTADDPLKTITYAYLKVIENSQDPHTIHLAEGIYSPSLSGETYPLKCRSYMTLSGVDKNTTILDAEQSSRLLNCIYSHASVQNLSVINGSSGGITVGYSSNI